MLIEINSMSAVSWNAWVAELRTQAEAMKELDNQTLARQLILWAAKRLSSDSHTMTAQTMVLLLNEIDQFRATGWLYSKERRGPCSSVRGAYNEFARSGYQSDAEVIAHSYTNLQGEYAYAN